MHILFCEEIHLQGIWQSVLHHITNTHEWILSQGGVNHCLHEDLGGGEDKAMVVTIATLTGIKRPSSCCIGQETFE